MPKLLLFAPCEKVIVAQGENTVSLMTILQSLEVSLKDVDDIPKNTTLPVRWNSFSLWQSNSEEIGKEIEQRVELVTLDGKVRMKTDSKFVCEKPFQRIIVRFQGFPVSKSGNFLLKLSLKNHETNEWDKKAEFPLELKFVQMRQ